MLKKTQIRLKPWGREIWFAHTDQYASKVLELKKGHRFSLQYHEKKQETQYILNGKIKFTSGRNLKRLKTRVLNPGDKIEILPYTIHRAEALKNTQILEVSTPELNDIVKIEDDYGRKGKGNQPALDRKLSSSQKRRSKNTN